MWTQQYFHHLCYLSSSSLSSSLSSSSLVTSITRVCSAKRCQQPPEWAVLSHIQCISQNEVVGFLVITVLSCVIPGRPSSLLQPSGGSANRIFLASILYCCPFKLFISSHITSTVTQTAIQDFPLLSFLPRHPDMTYLLLIIIIVLFVAFPIDLAIIDII